MTQENLDPKTQEPTGVQHDSETPFPKKPSVLFIVTTSLGVLTILWITLSAYHGVAQ